MKRIQNQAFTLIELLSVVAIIAILATVLVPTAGHMMEKARRTKAANNLRQVAIAYASTQIDDSFNTVQTKSYHTFIRKLSEQTHLNDPRIWIQSDDPKVIKRQETIPASLYDSKLEEFPISISVASFIPPHAPASTTPIAWTRGLLPNGYWDAENGVYGIKGGFIAFLDGHVQWFDNIAEEPHLLLKLGTQERTPNIEDATGAYGYWEQAGTIR